MADISIRAVKKSYGKTAVVHGVDLDIQHGEFVVILGPSGCGKSTLLRMIAGLEDITGGEIRIGGERVNEREPRERGCAMVFQNYALYPHMTVADNIGYALKVAGLPKAERLARVLEVARTVGLGDFLDRKPGQLSGGQRQRVAMARAMIREPKVFLFDEPLSNLDAQLRVQLRIEIRRLHRRLSVTSVFVTHDQIEAMTLADRLVVMNAGVIEQVGAPAEVYRRPNSRFVAGFLGSPAMNFLNGVLRDDGALQLASGTVLLPPAPAWRGPRRDVAIGVRPEHATIAPGTTRPTLPITLEFVEELGVGRLGHGLLDGVDFAVLLPPESTTRQGDTVQLGFVPEMLHLFDPVSGARIEPPVAMRSAA